MNSLKVEGLIVQMYSKHHHIQSYITYIVSTGSIHDGASLINAELKSLSCMEEHSVYTYHTNK